MWKKYRRVVELIQAILIIGLPFVRIGGASALRFDIPELKLYFFGTVIWINEFYLFLLATLFFIFLIVFITLTFGRIWCGWLCPQTVLLDFSSDIAGLFKLNPYHREIAQKVVLIPLAALVSMTLIWYFVPPAEMIRSLFVSKVITGFFFTLWAVIYAELAFLGRRFCKTICPYSMLQSGLFDRDTLVIAFEEREDESCMGCDKCVRVCPVGIDIKKGIRRECVACAGCIDACISMTDLRGIQPFIGYRGRIVRPKTILVGAVTLIMGMVLLFITYTRPELGVVLSRDPEQPIKGLNRYTYSIQNNTGKEKEVHISVMGNFVLIGKREITVPPYAIYRGKVMVKATRTGKITLVFKYDGNKVLRKEVGFL